MKVTRVRSCVSIQQKLLILQDIADRNINGESLRFVARSYRVSAHFGAEMEIFEGIFAYCKEREQDSEPRTSIVPQGH